RGASPWSPRIPFTPCGACSGRSTGVSTAIGCEVRRRAWGHFPPINIFQRGDDFVALVELPGVSKNDIEIQAKDRSIRLAGSKTVSFQDTASVHRRERVSGVFDRTITLPVQLDVDRLKADYKDGVLALFIPRAESDKPRSIKIG
ncbi:MAG TPA: Hsp20/alpha crystallin family protein, partial [Hyphomicrobiaceae bacterium]|nr:Hsp20/alpha crystallin family protein [Hyphomicrobiaceae bacterium]